MVFDEASQLQTCKAVGSLARAKNAIIVGDPKQMPPTSFFQSQTSDEEFTDISDLESVLEDCLAINMSETYLQWHYRSRHESLISFSNAQFYGSNLCTFPSADDSVSRVRLVNVPGHYEGGGMNSFEAKAVVEELLRRYRTANGNPPSIGVITFNVKQQNLIEDLLEEEYGKNPAFESWALSGVEPLFVKNLENVQGDERDVILFSITYAPDENGKMAMRFGPVNAEGGWRRLNVAVTRSRCEMTVFATLKPEQIDLNRTPSKGVRALKNFLEFAKTRQVHRNRRRCAQDGRLSRRRSAQSHRKRRLSRSAQRRKLRLQGGYRRRERRRHRIPRRCAARRRVLRFRTKHPRSRSGARRHPEGTRMVHFPCVDHRLVGERAEGDEKVARISGRSAKARCRTGYRKTNRASGSGSGSQRISRDARRNEHPYQNQRKIPRGKSLDRLHREREPSEERQVGDSARSNVGMMIKADANIMVGDAAADHGVAHPSETPKAQDDDVESDSASNVENPFALKSIAQPSCPTALFYPRMNINQTTTKRFSPASAHSSKTKRPSRKTRLCNRVRESFGIARSGKLIQARNDEMLDACEHFVTQRGSETFIWRRGDDPRNYKTCRIPAEGVETLACHELCDQELVALFLLILEDRETLTEDDLIRAAATRYGYKRVASKMHGVMSAAIAEGIRNGMLTKEGDAIRAL